jgi:corrinoid protein of di/trimethylamine methyltransferase
MDEILKKISELVAQGEEEDSVVAVKEAIAKGIDPLLILNEGAAKGMDIVGTQYSNGEAYLPELVLAGDAMTAVISVIFANMDKEQIEKSKVGTVVIGQAKGDVHDIGKNVVAALLAVNGFVVHDLGTDVPFKEFFEKAKSEGADIIAVSTLLTTSLPYLEDTINYIRDKGNRDKFRYIVGGGPVTSEFAKKINADGWSRSAFDCVELCKTIMKMGTPGSYKTVLVDSEAR